jgi:site-specific recombinase XerD
VSRIKLKYVHPWVDRRYGKVKVRQYFRRRGQKQIPLPGIPGSAEFNAAYEMALSGSRPATPIGLKRIRAGSIGALVIAWFNSPDFLTLSPSTQRTYRGILEPFTRDHGDKPLALLTRKHIEAMLAKRVKTPAAANHWLRLVKTLLRFAVKQELRADDPSIGIDFIRRKASGFHSWDDCEIAQFEAHWPVGSKPRLALALLTYTGQRRSDVVCMGRQHLRPCLDAELIKLRVRNILAVKQQKTGAPLAIPVHPALQAVLDATPSEHLTFLVTEYGKPFTAAGFGGWFRERCDNAALPKHCAAHGLRKAAGRRLAEAGCSANVIAAILGHATLREVERYTRAAEQERLAGIGMAAIIARTESGNRS